MRGSNRTVNLPRLSIWDVERRWFRLQYQRKVNPVMKAIIVAEHESLDSKLNPLAKSRVRGTGIVSVSKQPGGSTTLKS